MGKRVCLAEMIKDGISIHTQIDMVECVAKGFVVRRETDGDHADGEILGELSCLVPSQVGGRDDSILDGLESLDGGSHANLDLLLTEGH